MSEYPDTHKCPDCGGQAVAEHSHCDWYDCACGAGFHIENTRELLKEAGHVVRLAAYRMDEPWIADLAKRIGFHLELTNE